MTVQSPDFDMCMIAAIFGCLIMYRHITGARDQFWLLIVFAFALGLGFTIFMEVPSGLSVPAYSVFVVTVMISAYVYEWQVASLRPCMLLRLAYVIDVGLISGVMMWFIIR